MSDIDQLRQWITRQTALVESMVYKNVTAFELGLAPPPSSAGVGALAVLVSQAHAKLGEATVQKYRRPEA